DAKDALGFEMRRDLRGRRRLLSRETVRLRERGDGRADARVEVERPRADPRSEVRGGERVVVVADEQVVVLEPREEVRLLRAGASDVSRESRARQMWSASPRGERSITRSTGSRVRSSSSRRGGCS